jgi:hypothetical protein
MQVLLAVELKVDAKRELARVLEISAGGLRVEASPTCDEGNRIFVRRGEVSLAAKVIWKRGTTLGIKFHEEIDEHEFLRFRNSKHQCALCNQQLTDPDRS